jgi:hypothetical protein
MQRMIRMIQTNGMVVTEDTTWDKLELDAPMDIAMSMGRICRYAGQIPVSVLSHSLLVGGIIASQYRMVNMETWNDLTDTLAMAKAWAFGMLHDVHETIVGDIVWIDRPEWYHNLTREIDRCVHTRARLHAPGEGMVKCIKIADMMSRWFEVTTHGTEAFKAAFESVGAAWLKPEGPIVELGQRFMNGGYAKLDRTSVDGRGQKQWSGPMHNFIHWLEILLNRGNYLLAFNGFMQKCWDQRHPLFQGMVFKTRTHPVKNSKR